METNFCKLVRKKLKLLILIVSSFVVAFLVILTITFIRSKIIEARIRRFQAANTANPQQASQIEDIDKNSTSSKLTTFFSLDFCKIMNDQFLEDYFIIYISLSLTVFIYFWNALKSNVNHEYWCKFSRLKIKKRSASFEKTNSNSDMMNSNGDIEKSESDESEEDKPKVIRTIIRCCSRVYQFLRLSKLKNVTICGIKCSCGIEFPVPMNPFSKRNRFITGVIYAAYTYNILKIFEYLLIGDQTHIIEHNKKLFQNMSSFSNFSNFSSIRNSMQEKYQEFGSKLSEHGILMELLKQICNVFIIGFRYYPVLLCVELKRKSKLCYFLCTLYVMFLLFYYVYMNMFCLLSAYNTIKNAYQTIDSTQKSSLLNSLNLNLEKVGLRSSKVDNLSSNYLLTTISTTTLFSRNRSRFLRQNIELSNSKIDKVVSTLNKSETYIDNVGKNFTDDLQAINKSLFLNHFMYEKFIFYAVLFLISFYMITEFVFMIVESIRRRRAQKEMNKKCSCCRKNLDSREQVNNVEELHINCPEYSEKYSIGKVYHEIKYTKELLKPKIRKPISFTKYLFEKYVYKNRRDFRYSKQFINTQIIAFILLYYITCLIIRKSKLIVSLSSNLLILVINFIFKMNTFTDSSFLLMTKNQLNKLVLSLYDNISNYIVFAACFTTAVYVTQLFLGIKNYHRHVLNAYKGVYVDIPSPKRFSNAKLASSSLHHRYFINKLKTQFDFSKKKIIFLKF